jgi:hypothetical protein
MEPNFVTNWLRRDPTRWISGGLAGLFSAVLAMVLAMGLAKSAGFEAWFPVKLFGTLILGSAATEFTHPQGALVGALIIGALAIVLGIAFAHFVYTNAMAALLAMGLVWGVFSWIFIWNLFLQSYKTVFAAQISSVGAFPVCILFGIALASVSFFDRMLRGR